MLALHSSKQLDHRLSILPQPTRRGLTSLERPFSRLKCRTPSRSLTFVWLFAAMAVSSSAHGGLIMESFTSTSEASSGNAIGWRFRPNVNITATGLAMYDVPPTGVGFFDGYDVHLWTDTGTELGAVHIPPGTVAPLVDGFRTADLATPIALDAGTIYRVSVDYGDNGSNGNELYSFPTTVTMNSAITLIANSGTAPAGLDDFALAGANNTFPDVPQGAAFVGPNVVFSSSAVPEPSTLLLSSLVFGIGTGVGVLRHRRRRNSKPKHV